MYFNTIDFPNQIVDAAKDGKLVVFAGAGASIDPPTSLPDFEKLAMKIADGTGYTRGKNVPFEVFLGKLKSQGIKVNEEAAEILSSSCLEHNKLHEAIINIFPDKNTIKIVTTNYDCMFESVLNSNKIKTPIYSAPALPLGDDVHGIVHIHGDVNNPNYMVVTDEDFGRAYITEGYASRFLVKLFEKNTILFIGYSYGDTILRYLTRAMYRDGDCKRFILTTDDESDWDSFGITPIYYPKDKHTVMRKGIEELGKCLKKNLFDWKNEFLEIAEAPPEDLTIDAEIDYCLENSDKTKILINCIYGKNWVNFLDNKNVFDNCFSEIGTLSEIDSLWANWLCENFLEEDSELIINLILKHNNVINKKFANILAGKICEEESLKDNIFLSWVILLKNKITDFYIKERLVEQSINRNYYMLGFDLFKSFFELKFNVQKHFGVKNESFEFTHKFEGEYYITSRCWEKIRKKVCENVAYDVLTFAYRKIEEVYNYYLHINDCEPFDMVFLDVEGEKIDYKIDLLKTLAVMYIDSADIMQKQDLESLRLVLLKNFESKSILLKKICLCVMRRTKALPANESISMLVNHNLLEDFYLEKQVYQLVVNCFNDLSAEEKNNFIDIIETRDKMVKRDEIYDSYKWCVWLREVDPQNPRLNAYVNKVGEEYEFALPKSPELSDELLCEPLFKDNGPYNQDELLNMKKKEVVQHLLVCGKDDNIGESRYGLLKTFSKCISQNYGWTKQIVEELCFQKIDIYDVWQHLFYGIEASEYDVRESIILLKTLTEYKNTNIYNSHLAAFLLHILRNNKVKDAVVEYEEILLHIIDALWEKRDKKDLDLDKAVDNALGSACGMITTSLVYLLFYSHDKEIPCEYAERLEQFLNVRGKEKYTVVCILAGYFNVLCRRDKEWTLNNISGFLDGSNVKFFACAWDGYVFFSKRIYKETADIIKPIFIKAISRLGLLSNESKYGFIYLLLTMLLYFIDKPTHKVIPELYKASSENDTKIFINAINSKLKNMEDSEIEKWWNDWLKLFIKNRKRNKPSILSEIENSALLELLINLEVVFDDAVNVICSAPMPKEVDSLFWYCFYDSHIAQKHSNSAFKVLTTVLKSVSNIGLDEQSIKNIVKDMGELDTDKEVELKEVLLEKNIRYD